MHEQNEPPTLELVEQRGERLQVVQGATGHAGAGAAVEQGAGPERHEPAARAGGERRHALVVGVAQLGRQAERRRAGDEGDVDAVAIEQLDPPRRVVVSQVDLELALGELEPAPAQPRPLGSRLERPDQRLRPEVLVDVDTRQTALNTRTARQTGSLSKSRYFVRSIVSSPSPSRGPGTRPLCSRTEW